MGKHEKTAQKTDASPSPGSLSHLFWVLPSTPCVFVQRKEQTGGVVCHGESFGSTLLKPARCSQRGGDM